MKRLQINMNGNDKETLLKELRTASEAVEAARVALGMLTLHGRNYQTVENGQLALRLDIGDAQNAAANLTQVREYLSECYAHVVTQ